MFITIQFPLFDNRHIFADKLRTVKPEWPKPQQNDRVRYFGEIIDRKNKYLGPWDDEKKYCTAHSVINLCGIGKDNFYKGLHESPSQSRVLFRRFQSDGKCLSKFDIGFNDDFEKTISATALAGENINNEIFDHIRKYLLCPVKIRIGNRLTAFVPLVDAGKYLKSAYYWATTKGKKTFDPKDMDNKVEHCEPVLLVQLDASLFSPDTNALQYVKVPELEAENIQLSLRFIPYKIGRYNYNMKSWIFSVPKSIANNAITKKDFRNYSPTLRNMRINLLRIHVEVAIQNKFLGVLNKLQNGQLVADDQAIIRIYTYLHKLFLNLSNIKRNKQPQEALVQATFRIDEMYAHSESIEELMESAKYFMVWLKTLPLTPQTIQVTAYLDKFLEDYDAKNTASKKEKTVFISYNHGDSPAANILKSSLESNSVNVIMDTISMKAGTDIESFIGESISNSNATISLVSDNSLRSGWVAMETVNILNFEKLFKNKNYIPCCLNENFTKDNFVNESMNLFDKRLKEIANLILEQDKKDADSRNFNDEKSRIYFLKSNLDGIVGKLKKTKYINIEGDNLEKNFPSVLSAIE